MKNRMDDFDDDTTAHIKKLKDGKLIITAESGDSGSVSISASGWNINLDATTGENSNLSLRDALDKYGKAAK